MAFFITQCPNCKTSFNTRITQPHATDGMVRCGACLTVFEADENLLHEEELAQAEEISEAGTWDSQDSVSSTFDSDDHGLEKIVDSSPQPDSSAVNNEQEDAQSEAVEDANAEHENSGENDNIFLNISFLTDEQAIQNDESESEEATKINPFVASDVDDSSLISDDSTQQIVWHLVEEFSDNPEQYGGKPLQPDEGTNTESMPDIESVSNEVLNLNAEKETIRSQLLNQDLSDKGELEDLSHENLVAIKQISDPLLIDWRKRNKNYWKTFLYGSLCLIFSSTLVLQYFITHSDTLSQTALWRPWYESVCSTLDCEVKIPGDVGAIKSDSLMIRSHSTRENALVVNIIFHSEALFSQPYPAINLSFSDINNQPIASRVFLPGEYLHREPQLINLMQPQSPIQVRLEIIDPGSLAVNYAVSFHEI